MFSTLRSRFGIPGVISVIALVFAMFGGAYAASNSSGDQKATASAKAKRGPKGPRGPKGAKGDTGPQGLQGAAGSGSQGDKGDTGNTGSAGVSAEATSFSGAKGSCTEGGIEVKSAKPATLVCNGVKGANGTTGFTETLPSGKTETGSWDAVANTQVPEETILISSISYTIPLAAPSEHVVFLNFEKTEGSITTPVEGCKFEVESASAVPVAPTGTLCVFTTLEEAGTPKYVAPPGIAFESGQDSPVGALIAGKSSAAKTMRLFGVWAVTAK
jgi:hypothetical protein